MTERLVGAGWEPGEGGHPLNPILFGLAQPSAIGPVSGAVSEQPPCSCLAFPTHGGTLRGSVELPARLWEALVGQFGA